MKWVVFLFSVTSFFATAQTIDFRGVPMGAKEKLLLEKAPFFKCSTAGLDDYALADRFCNAFFRRDKGGVEDALFGGVAADYISRFYADQLFYLRIEFDMWNFEKLRDAMTEKFSKPSSRTISEYKTPGTLRVPNEILVWDRPDSFIEMARYGPNISTSYVEYRFKPLQNEYEKRSSALAKKRAKTL